VRLSTTDRVVVEGGGKVFSSFPPHFSFFIFCSSFFFFPLIFFPSSSFALVSSFFLTFSFLLPLMFLLFFFFSLLPHLSFICRHQILLRQLINLSTALLRATHCHPTIVYMFNLIVGLLALLKLLICDNNLENLSVLEL
jgi:hypothetical protein